MSKEKHKKHHKAHDQHKHKHELTLGEQSDQGTDMPQSQNQLQDEKTKLAKNARAEIVAVKDGSGGADVTIDLGASDGIEVGTVGYVVGKYGENFADFRVVKVDEVICHAVVDGITSSQLEQTGLQVVVNP